MRPSPSSWLPALAAALLIPAAAGPARAADKAPDKPADTTLPKVPAGFEARLVAAVPTIEYPLQLATLPDGTLLIAQDPMDQTGPYEAANGTIVGLRDGRVKGTFATGLRAVQGMAWHDGSLYVSHMPFLSVFRDADGDGKAESRVDLFKDLGPTDNKGLNDHIVSGIQFGIDGRLYISVGDKGVPGATGPDGRVVTLKGGGTLRCKPDGTGLEVFTSGTRNHLEANLNARDELFTYDNTDDGDGWWTRVTHHVDGGYYGYPFDYHDHPDRFLAPMNAYGGGSPCGAIFNEEDAWPESWRGVGFWAEWGKGKVHAFRFAPDGSTYTIGEAIDLADKHGELDFRPIDLAFSRDGRTLYVADWAMGGWGKSDKVGRVFAITYTGPAPATRPRGTDADPVSAQIEQLDHPALGERVRAQAALIRRGREALAPAEAALADPKTPPLALRHLVWVVDGIAGGTPAGDSALVAALKLPSAEARTQAARALGERARTAASPALVAALADSEPAVRLQAVIALGRLGGSAGAPALVRVLSDPDRYIAFSARQALRRIGSWDAVGQGLGSADAATRAGCLATLEGVESEAAVAELAKVAADRARDPESRAQALVALAIVHHKAPPWDGKWWGTRPSQAAPPARVESWGGTPVVATAIRSALADRSAPVRIAAVAAAKAAGDRDALPTLRDLLARDPDAEVRSRAAAALGSLGDREAVPALLAAIAQPSSPEPVHEAALGAIEALQSDTAVQGLIDLLAAPGPAARHHPRLIRALGSLRAKAAVPALVRSLDGADPATRVAAAEALGRIGVLEGVGPGLRAHLADPDPGARKAAIAASAAIGDREAIPALIAAADAEPTRFEAIEALAALPDLRKASASALASLREVAAPELDRLASRGELSNALLPELRKVFQETRPVDRWQVAGPFPKDATPALRSDGSVDPHAPLRDLDGKMASWELVEAGGRGFVDLHKHFGGDDRSAFAAYDFPAAEARQATFVVGSDDTMSVWLNGKEVYTFNDSRAYDHDASRFEAPLIAGTNHVVVRCGNGSGPWGFGLAHTPPVELAFLKGTPAGAFDPAAFRDFALQAKGDAAHGGALFADTKGLACVKCHSVGGQGGSVGPDLSAIGATYPRPELVTSILEPSAKIFSGYEPLIVATNDGRVLTGIVKSDTPDGLEIEDANGKRIRLALDEIDDRKASTVSLMPVGLVEGLTPQDFADLIAYLESLKATPPAKTAGGK